MLKGKKPSLDTTDSIQAVWIKVIQILSKQIQQQPVPFLSFTRRGCLRSNNESVKTRWSQVWYSLVGFWRGHSINNILSNNCLCSWLESYFGSWKPELFFACKSDEAMDSPCTPRWLLDCWIAPQLWLKSFVCIAPTFDGLIQKKNAPSLVMSGDLS